ncbi:MAG TPA: MMPL family transporter [Roseococcus sp.]|nr:MMPL family transporter [Roseococcus sp.]
MSPPQPSPPGALLGRLVVALVGRSVRWPVATLLLCAVVTVFAAWLTVTRFTLDSDVSKLFPDDLGWRVSERTLAEAFPERTDLVVAVLDGPDAGRLDRAAEALAERLRAQPQLFRTVRRPDAGEFWDRHGLLFLTEAEVAAVAERLIEGQALLGTIAADPSLRGLAEISRLMAEGLARGEAEPDRLAGPLHALATAAEAATREAITPPDWRALMTGQAPRPAELRRFIMIQPTLDYAQLSAGAAASEVIRAEARALRLAEQGVRLRLTGPVPMGDEEFATVADGAVLTGVLSFVLVGVLLWMALRSWRLIWPLLALTVVGIFWTAAFGILAVGSFNPLSIAFAVMFIGLGNDFGTQYAVQFRAESARLGQVRPALIEAARVAGPGMTLATLAIGLSFFAFMPTDYRGVAELGLIAGAGMFIGWLLAMIMLPALMLLARPGREMREVGYPALRPVDHWLSRHARLAGTLALLVALFCAGASYWLRFDTNPINLRDPQAESVATWRDLAQDPDTDPNTLEILAPNLAAAQALAARLEALPEVARATTLADFIPEGQEAKLFLIEDAAMLLGPALAPTPRAPPTEAETIAALREAALALAALRGAGPVAADARALAIAYNRLADGLPAGREALAEATLPGLTDTLRRVRLLLSAGPVTLESLPEALRRDWITATGQARIEIAPTPNTGGGEGDETTQLRRFARAVQAVAPDATGLAISAVESSATIQGAFILSGVIAMTVVVLLLWVALRSLKLSVLAVAPLALAGLLTMAHCALLGPDLNLANIIALPLLFGMGVAYDIYFVTAWQQGRRDLLASPLNRAVIYSAVTNAAAFGALMVSPHPGTASMGVVLSISLVYSLACVMLVLPPLLKLFATPPERAETERT